MKIKDLKYKKIGIWGLGREGRAVLEVLNSTYPEKDITILEDSKSGEFDQKLADSLADLDLVIRSPGVSIYKPEIIYAREKFGTMFITEKTLFFGELEGKNIIAITGTKGKTTTATFCNYVLEKLGYSSLLCGNIGIPAINLIDEARRKDFVVVELSSYQTSDLLSFPKISILLNLFPEHIDWHMSHEQYYRDKVNLLEGSETRIVNAADNASLEYTADMGDRIFFGNEEGVHYSNGYFYDGDIRLFSSENMKLKGGHNYQNICGALTALKFLFIDPPIIKQEYMDQFNPVEHRLETFTIKNVLFVNDSISTIPEATIACYRTFSDKNIYGILGGYDREQDYKAMIDYVINHDSIKYIALLGDTGKKIAELFTKKGFENFKICKDLDECMYILYDRAKLYENSVIILSPAAPSYDMFKNFEERGNLFKKIAESL